MTTMTRTNRLCATLAAMLLGATMIGACRRTDFTEAPLPAAGTSLLLRTAVDGDTTRVSLSLEGSVPLSLGSITGEVEHDAGWTFVGCDAAGANAKGLVACKANGNTVRLAGAWAAGTTHGALVQLLFVRASAVTSGNETWMLSVREMHTARGEKVTDEVQVRREALR